ncbi:MAG: serine hydrolase [Steroidobacteraceae bacterium]
MNFARFNIARAALAGPLLFLVICAYAQEVPPAPPPQDDSLVGVWSYQTSYGSPLRGLLTITRQNGGWRAQLADSEVSFQSEARNIRFAFPGDRGRFRGALEVEGAIRGFWIRPGITTDPRYPGGSSQAYATPMVLAPAGKNGWRGTVRPLDDPFTLYLEIFRNQAGALIGAFRNPEQNSHGPAMQYRVTREGDSVRFTAGAELAPDAVSLEAKYLPSTDRLHMRWEDLGTDIELERASDEKPAGYFPRPRYLAPYAYEPPAPTGDGWSTASAGEVGLDETALTKMVQGLIDADPAERRPSLIHSMLVAYRGKLVLEEYFFGFDADQTHDLRSAGKTFSSVLLGAAMRGGADIKPEAKIVDLMAAKGPFANPDPRKAEITLAHLLTHSAGLACNDNDDASPGNEGAMQAQRAQPDWWKYTLDLPMAFNPGARYAYCSANINLVGGALTVATETSLPELFEQRIARPLQFGEYHWNLMPNDEGYLGGGAFLRPRDFLKLGQAYLNGGVWNGKRIVDTAWVKESTAPRIHVSPETTGYSAEDFGNYYGEADDAYAWHLGKLHAGSRVIDTYVASGNGGQLLIVVPEFQLAVVFTGGNYTQGGIWSRWGEQLIGGQVIPAIRARPASQ